MKSIKGDLIKDATSYDVIVHGCNCFNTMGSGIAAQIKVKFPEAYEVDQKTQSGDQRKLGTITFTEHTNPVVVNAYTQFRFGRDKRHCDYDAVRTCMQDIKAHFRGKKIGMPQIGAGLAGGDWDIIQAIIEEELEGEDVTVVIWDKGK